MHRVSLRFPICLSLAVLALYGPRVHGAEPETVAVEADGARLTGSLFLPESDGPFPAVILTHGSEPGRRDHAGYVRMAEALRAGGIAALSFDKRGCGDSTGTYVEAPDLDRPAGDVVAWLGYLEQRPEIRGDRIGVLGWSQGGWVGPLAASRSKLAFVVAISGPGVSPLEQNIFDKTNRFRAGGATPEQVRTFERTIRLVWTYLVHGTGHDEALAAWNAIHDEAWFRDHYDGPPMMERARVLAHPRMVDYVAHSKYEPVPALRKLRVPMLAVFGGADTIVPVEESIKAMRRAFRESGNDRFTYEIFPNADHGIHVRQDNGRFTPAPGYPEFVVDWIAEVTGR